MSTIYNEPQIHSSLSPKASAISSLVGKALAVPLVAKGAGVTAWADLTAGVSRSAALSPWCSCAATTSSSSGGGRVGATSCGRSACGSSGSSSGGCGSPTADVIPVVHINPRSGADDAAQCQSRAQFLSPGDTGSRSASTSVSIFAVVNVVKGDAPGGPSSWADDRGHVGVLEDGASICAPWTTEVSQRAARLSIDFGFVDDIVRWVAIAVTTVCSDVTIARNNEVTLFEPCNGTLTEDEISGALNVAVLEDISAFVGEEGILVSKKLAAVVALIVALCTESDGLNTRSTRVMDIDVVKLKVSAVGSKSSRGVVASSDVSAEAVDQGDLILIVVLVIGSIAVDGDAGLDVLVDVDLAAVATGLNEDDDLSSV